MYSATLGPPKAWTIHRYYITITVISHRTACLLPRTLNSAIQTCYLHQVVLSLALPLCCIFMEYDCTITAEILLKPKTDSIWWSNSIFCESKKAPPLSLSLSHTSTHARTRSSCPRIPCSSIQILSHHEMLRVSKLVRPALIHSSFTHAFTFSFVRPLRFYQRERCRGYALNILSRGS